MSLVICPIGTSDYKEWDAFVERSPQGTIFCTTKWLNLFEREYWIFGCYREGDSELQGGIAFFEDEDACYSGGTHTAITPFQGILVANPPEIKPVNLLSLQNKVTETLIEALSEYKTVEVCNHYNLTDVLPFVWAGYSQGVRATSVVDLSDLTETWRGMEKDHRNEINKAQRAGLTVKVNKGLTAFDYMYGETFARKGLERTASKELIQKLFQSIDNILYMVYQGTKPLAGAMMIWDSKRAYYILGASTENNVGASYLALWSAMGYVAEFRSEVDLVGINNKNIGLFKRGFGGTFKQYIEATKNTPSSRG